MAVAPKRNAMEILGKLVPLNTLGEAGLSELLDSAVFEKLKRGAVLFNKGDTASLNVYLLSGKVALLSGKQEMDTVDAKDDTARFPLAHQIPRKFTVVARSRVEVVRVDNRLLGQLVAQAFSSPYEVAAVDGDVPDDWMSQLLQLPVFQQLPPSNIQRVIMGMEEIDLEQGEPIFGQGDEGDYFYLINKGQCSISRSAEEGEEELARPGPGESFGEESLLSGRPRAGSATMLRSGTLVRLAKARFMDSVTEPLFQRVSYQYALDAIEQGALWLDVRPSPAFEKAHLPASINLPLSSLRYQSSSLDPDRNYIVCCDDVGDQATAAYLLLEQRFKVTLLEGGMPEVTADQEEQKPPVQGGDVIDLHPAKGVAAEAEPGPVQDDKERLKKRLIKAELLARQQQDQLKKLKQELKEAGSRLTRAEQQGAEFEDRSATLDEETARLRQTLQEKSDALAGLVEQAGRIEALQAEKVTVEACMADLEDTIASLRQSLEDERTKQGEAGNRIEALEQERDQSAGERDAARGEIAGIETRLTEQERESGARLEQSTEALQRLQQELDEERQRLTQAQSKQQQAESEAAALQTQQTETEAELHAAREKLQQLEQSSQEALQETTGRLERAHQEQAGQAQQLEQLLIEREAAEGQLVSVRQEITLLSDEAGAGQAELDELHKQLESSQRTLDDARAGQSEAERKRQQLETRLSEHSVASEQHYAAQQQLIEQLQQDLANEKERFGETGHALVQLELEKSKAADELQTLKEGLQQRDVELGRQMQALALAEKALEQRDTAPGQDLEQLHNELKEACEARDVAEDRLQQLQLRAVTGDDSDTGEQKALYAEIKTLTDALEESEKSYDEMVARVAQLGSDAPAAGVAGDEAEVEQLLHDKQAAEQEVERLGAEVGDLRSVMAQYVRQIQAAKEGVESESVDALRTELELVREQAETDLASMREELEALRSELQERQLNGSAEVAENEALKQELEAMSRRLEQQQEEVRQAKGGQNSLLEDVELNKSEVARLKEALEIATVDAEESEFKRKEEIDMRRQLEESHYQLQQEMGESRARELLSGDPASGMPASIEQEAKGPARGRALLSALAGALIAFGVADGLSIVSGGGELIGSLLQGRAPVRMVREPTSDPVSPAGDRPQLQAAVQADSPAVAATEPANRQVATDKAPVSKQAAEQALAPEMIAVEPNGLIRDRPRSGIRGPAMQTIRGGKLIMGSERDPLAVEERPAHEVAIADFAIGRSEVTFAEYDAFARDTGRNLPDDQGWGRGQRPVINVTWKDARDYASWLSGRTGQRYRLPTEAEWEYAAAGGSDSYYWWGYEVGDGLANCFNCGSRWDGWQTAPIGSFGENPYGLQNTAGNVMEWVEDCYHPNYEGAPDDGSAWSEPDCGQRVVRGGAFNRPVDALRVTYRSHFDQTARLPMLGFRLARDLRR